MAMWKHVPRRDGDGDLKAWQQANDTLLVGGEANNMRGDASISPPGQSSKPSDFKQVITTAQVQGQRDISAVPKESFLRRAGQRSWGLSVLTVAAVSAAIGFLTWLWYGDRTERRWRQLVLDGWTNQAVAITSAILRTALSLLGGIATSMIASVALERRGVSLKGAVQLSVARFTNPDPTTFWQKLLLDRHFIDLPLRALLFVLLLSTLALQAFSTILLSDLEIGPVLGFVVPSTNGTGFAWANAEFGKASDGVHYSWRGDFENHNNPFQFPQDFWTGQLRAAHAFAEYAEPPTTDHEEIDDTGRTLRAFLPVDDVNIRREMTNFTGLAPVFDTRVVCVRPEFVEGSLQQNVYDLTLTLPDRSDVIPGYTTTTEHIHVQLPRIEARGSLGWLIHPLQSFVGGLHSPLDASGLEGLDLAFSEYTPEERRPSRFRGRVTPSGVWRTSDERSCGVDLGNAWVVMDTRGPFNPLGHLLYSRFDRRRAKSGPGRGPWLRIDLDEEEEDDWGEKVEAQTDDRFWTMGEVTVCFDSLPKGAQYHHIQDFEIKVSGAGRQFEPRTALSGVDATGDVIALREQLGSAKNHKDLDLDSRNLFRLDSVNEIHSVVKQSAPLWKEYCSSASEIESDAELYWDPNIYNRSTYSWVKEMALGDQSIALCTGLCNVLGRSGAAVRSSRALAWIVDETIRGENSTGSPALAMRAALTQVLRDTFYSYLVTFDHLSEVETLAMQSVLIPGRYRGLWAVFGVTFLHLGLCLVAWMLFATLTETSSLNNSWQAVAEVVNHEDGRRVVEEAGHMKDDKVNQWINAHQEIHQRFNVRRGRR